MSTHERIRSSRVTIVDLRTYIIMIIDAVPGEIGRDFFQRIVPFHLQHVCSFRFDFSAHVIVFIENLSLLLVTQDMSYCDVPLCNFVNSSREDIGYI